MIKLVDRRKTLKLNSSYRYDSRFRTDSVMGNNRFLSPEIISSTNQIDFRLNYDKQIWKCDNHVTFGPKNVHGRHGRILKSCAGDGTPLAFDPETGIGVSDHLPLIAEFDI